MPLIAALSISTSLTRSVMVSQVSAPPFVPIATEPIPAVPMMPVGSLDPPPSIATSSIFWAIAFKRSSRMICSTDGSDWIINKRLMSVNAPNDFGDIVICEKVAFTSDVAPFSATKPAETPVASFGIATSPLRPVIKRAPSSLNTKRERSASTN